MSDEPTTGKIHIDSDWKAEAAATKKRLAAEEQAERAEARGPQPAATVAELVNMIAMPAAMALGGYRTPDGQVVGPDLGAAKFHIDLLDLFEQKTKGNLTNEESRELATLLHQLRTHFAAVVDDLGTAAAAPPPGDQG